MNKEEKRKEFLEALSKITNHMNWCKIKINPEDREQINDSRIKYDYVAWKADNDSIMDKINKIENINKLSLIDRIIKLHFMVCEYFVFDEICYFLRKYDKEKNICFVDQKYGRNPNNKWIEERKNIIEEYVLNYLDTGMDYMVISSWGIEILSSKDFFDNIQDCKYLPNKNRNEVIKEIEYNG